MNYSFSLRLDLTSRALTACFDWFPKKKKRLWRCSSGFPGWEKIVCEKHTECEDGCSIPKGTSWGTHKICCISRFKSIRPDINDSYCPSQCSLLDAWNCCLNKWLNASTISCDYRENLRFLYSYADKKCCFLVRLKNHESGRLCSCNLPVSWVQLNWCIQLTLW